MTGRPPAKQHEWSEQWARFQDDAPFLFFEWIAPATIDDFADKAVLEAGCGGGQHTRIIADVAKSVIAVDLNTAAIAEKANAGLDNTQFIEADIATMDLGRQFDVVVCVGVIHHTDDPEATFDNLYRHLRPGGRMIVWTYSAEGNGLVRFGVEPVRKLFLRRLPRSWVAVLAKAVTALLYVPAHTLYRLRVFRFLPYWSYFAHFRRLEFDRNALNVFDKLNAPQTQFPTRERVGRWFGGDRFDRGSIGIRHHAGVSYSLVGTKSMITGSENGRPECSA